jgi:hypothetical protein
VSEVAAWQKALGELLVEASHYDWGDVNSQDEDVFWGFKTVTDEEARIYAPEVKSDLVEKLREICTEHKLVYEISPFEGFVLITVRRESYELV